MTANSAASAVVTGRPLNAINSSIIVFEKLVVRWTVLFQDGKSRAAEEFSHM